MTMIQYGDLAKLYGENAAVVREAQDTFKKNVNRVLDEVRDAVSRLAGVKVKEKVTGEGRIYRYWSLDTFDRPHVWFSVMDPRIVSPGEIILRVWAGGNLSEELLAKVRHLSAREEIGPFIEQEPNSIVSVRYESKDGLPVEQLAAKVATLLTLLRDI